jgi:hypothetical protein
MRREECVEFFERIPARFHPQINLVMRNQSVISVDIAARFEETYVVVRGREGGTTDEGRGFFVPYEEISYVRVERVMKISDFKAMYGETGYVDEEDKLGQAAEAEAAAAQQTLSPTDTPPPTPTPLPLPSDPASIAKQNLLDRIRAARASATGRLGR